MGREILKSLRFFLQILTLALGSSRPNIHLERASPNDTFPERTSGSSYFTSNTYRKVPGVNGKSGAINLSF